MDSPLWRLDQVTVPGRTQPRLDQLTVEILPGITAVLGSSGAGKSTLLNLLVDFERPTSGTVQRVAKVDDHALPMDWSPPGHGLWPQLTVREHIIECDETADSLLAMFDLASLAGALPATLSQGERDRLALARAVASAATILVLDEPLAHVSAGTSARYWERVLEQRPAGSSIVFATHDPQTVLRLAEHVICLEAGQLIFAGRVADLYHSPRTEQEACFLGPINWFDAEARREWLSEPAATTDRAVRPERLSLQSDVNSTIRIEKAISLGTLTETRLARGSERRTVYHRTEPVQAGMSVAIKILLLICAAWIPGCRPAHTDPELPVRKVDYWSVPPAGTKIPAPRAVHVGPDRETYVLDNAGRVLVYDEYGAIRKTWWMPDYSVGRPEGIFALLDGRIAVADTHYHRVVFFDHDGKFLSSFGSLGREPGEFIYPVKLTQDPEGFLYVCEYGDNDRVQKFLPDGTFVKQFGSFGTGPGQFQRPSGIVWFEHKLYIVDAFNNRIQVFSEDGDYQGILNSDANAALYYPYDISITRAGHLYVAEYGANRVSKFDLDGNLLARYGTSGGGQGQFSTPWSIAVDSLARVLVADTGNRRVMVLSLRFD